MNMTVDASGGDDQVLTRDDFGRRANHKVRIDAVHGVGISRFTDLDDAAVPNADIAFYDSPVVDDDGVGDDEVENARVVAPRHVAILAHAVTNDFAAAKSNFIAIHGEVIFDFDQQGRVGEADAIAHCGSVKIGVSTAIDE